MDRTQRWQEFFEHALALGLDEDDAIDYADHRLYLLDQRERDDGAHDLMEEFDD
jgi:hypothetical protein